MYIGNTWNTWFLLVTDFVCQWSSIEVELSPVTWVQVIRGGMNSKRSESMRNVTTIPCMFYLYRYVYVITYKCRGRNAGNNKSDKISILVLSILVQRYLVSLISTCNERYLCCRDMQQLLYDYWRLIAKPSHQSLTIDREKLETFTRFHRIYNRHTSVAIVGRTCAHAKRLR